MKKIVSIFSIVLIALIPLVSEAAVTVKKAAPVATKKADTMESATSLVPTVMGLVTSVKTLTAQQQQLEADCVPTNDEISTVNNLVKEWAKIGDTTAREAVSGLGKQPCSTDNNYDDKQYQAYLEFYADGDNDTCYLTFSGSGDKGMIWEDFPKVSKAHICQDGSKKCKDISNIYDVFTKIPFGQEDLVKSESNKVVKLMEKSQRCAPSKITEAKRQLWGGFLTQTLSGVGQTTGAAGTDSVIQAVSSMGGSTNLQSIGGALLPSLGGFLNQ